VNTQESRSRVVVFRLTETEYALLKRACLRAHRSVSEYARVELLSSVLEEPEDELGAKGFRQVGQALSKVQTRLEELKELLLWDRKNVNARARGGIRQD
jgi:hypothetical protein